MISGTPAADPADALREQFEQELRRVVNRLRQLSLERLARPAPPWSSRVAAARATAQVLADAAHDLESPAGRRGSVRRDVPALADRAAADLVAVTGYDVVLALRAPPAATPQAVEEEVVRRAVAALTALRQAL